MRLREKRDKRREKIRREKRERQHLFHSKKRNTGKCVLHKKIK